MLILAAETSTTRGSVTLLRDGQILGSKFSSDQKKHTEFINFAIGELLSEHAYSLSDVDLFACGIGPGSFTGIRVSVNVIRSYAKILNRPAYIANSLEILAAQSQQMTICMINAYKNMVYWGVYQRGVALDKPTAIFVRDIEKRLQTLGLNSPAICLGDGFNAYRDLFSKELQNLFLRDSNLSDYPSSENLALLAHQSPTKTTDWKSIIPLYIRASEAEENLKK